MGDRGLNGGWGRRRGEQDGGGDGALTVWTWSEKLRGGPWSVSGEPKSSLDVSRYSQVTVSSGQWEIGYRSWVRR